MKSGYLLFLSWAVAIPATAQEPVSKCARILFTSADLNTFECDSNIKRVNVALFSKDVVIKYRNKNKVRIPQDSIWGIRQKNSYPYRLYNGNYYKLYSLSPLYRYSKKIGKHTSQYFSVTLDSEIYSFSKEQLKRQVDSATYSAVAKENNRNPREMALDISVTNTKLLGNSFTGGALLIRYYPFKKLAGGLHLGLSQRQVTDTFGFSIGRPVITTGEIGLLCQFDLIQQSRFRTGVTIVNGVLLMDLRDRSVKEQVSTRHGSMKVSKEIATNIFYMVQPGLDLSYKLFSNNRNPDFFLSCKMNYRLAVGNANFGSVARSGGFTFGIGLSLIGFDRELL